MTFLDENCLAFDNEEENKLEFTGIHNVRKLVVILAVVQKDCRKLTRRIDERLRSNRPIVC